MTETAIHPLCRSAELVDGGLAVPFDVNYRGQTCRAFAIRHADTVRAYLNRCTHVAMELDWQPNRLFDETGRWLVCASHGAMYRPNDGACAGGPCRGPLVSIALSEAEGVVRWHTAHDLRAVEF